jgi:hypothetical protein
MRSLHLSVEEQIQRKTSLAMYRWPGCVFADYDDSDDDGTRKERRKAISVLVVEPEIRTHCSYSLSEGRGGVQFF